MELKDEIKESERILSKLDKEIADLKLKVKSEKNPLLLEVNKELDKQHNNNLLDIADYKSQKNEIENILKEQNSEIDALKKENEKLKANKKKNKSKSPINKIRGIQDLTKSFGLKKRIKKKIENEEDSKIKEDKKKEEEKKKEIEKLKKLKTENEILLKKLIEKLISYFEQVEIDMTYTTNYRNFIDSLNNQIGLFKQQLRISIIGGVDFNYAQTLDKFVKLLSNDMNQAIYIINQLDRIFDIFKNRVYNEAENTLKDIQEALSEINSNNISNYGFLLNKMNFIIMKTDHLKEICELLKKDLSEISNKRKDIEERIKNININFENLMNNYKKGKEKIKDDIRETIRKKGRNIFDSIDKSLRKEKFDKIDEENEEICNSMTEENYNDTNDDNIIRGDTLIKIKDFGKNINLFKTQVLFNNKDEAKENRSKEPKILKKNWNEVCYIYDDYDIHDINFEIKAVGLGPLQFFNSFGYGFYMGNIIEILDFEINGSRAKYNYEDYSLESSINLKNLEKAKVHLKYRERPNFNKMNENEKAVYLYYRKSYYGLSKDLEGQMGKFRLILKGNFEIVSFEEDFFIRNKENKKEKEYIWGGKIPPGGKRTLTELSKKEAIWNVSYIAHINSKSGNLRNTTLRVPTAFLDGNNDIIKMEYSSPQTKNIMIDEEKREFEIKYENTQSTEGNFKLYGQIKNKCKGEWKVDLTDEIIEEHIPIEDKKDKQILAKIARNIINEYDRNNEKNILSFMDFSKIGKWVYKNIKYDIKYSGRTELTAMDIYNKRVGVCHHMTRLANALLYSLGYQVIYASGYTCSERPRFDKDTGHCWSLINVKGKWYPFDATWNILSGKIPVCHIFFNFFNKSVKSNGTDLIDFPKDNSKCIIEYYN